LKLRGEIVNFADFAALWININSLWSGAWCHRDYVADRFGDLADVLSPSRQVCTVKPILELIRETFQLSVLTHHLIVEWPERPLGFIEE
jgi:hypothetical protein